MTPPPIPPCPFCNLGDGRIVTQNNLAVALWDRYPVNPGHALIVPRRHVATFFEATADEKVALFKLVDEVRALIDEEQMPYGYNIGINVGEAAGQTVMHLHVHLIPRFKGDVDDPTGGVRLVIPDKGNYKNPGFVPKSLKTDKK